MAIDFSTISSMSDEGLNSLSRVVRAEQDARAKNKATQMPPPDPHLIKFSRTSVVSAIKEYRAQHGCDLKTARAVINLYRNIRS